MKLLLSALSMILGGLIYIAFRKESLRMFTWFEDLGISLQVHTFRSWLAPTHDHIPYTIIYSLPNALWYLSGMLAFSQLWKNENEKWFWIFTVSIIAFGAEFGQAFRVIEGAFSISDVAFMVGSLGIFFALEALLRERENHEEKEIT